VAQSREEWPNFPGTTGLSWTPLRARRRDNGKIGWMCLKASDGCDKCYAETGNVRHGTHLPYDDGFLDQVDVFLDQKMLHRVFAGGVPKTYFVCSMTDLFNTRLYGPRMIQDVFEVMIEARRHKYIILTKYAREMHSFMRGHYPFLDRVAPHIVGMVSVEDQRTARERVPLLLDAPFAIRGVCAEPLLGPINLVPWLEKCSLCGVSVLDGDVTRWHYTAEACWKHMHGPTSPTSKDMVQLCDTAPDPRMGWIIGGGESGRHARPMQLDWLRDLRDQSVRNGIPFYAKQLGSRWAGSTRSEKRPDKTIRQCGDSAGAMIEGFPEDLRIREYPDSQGGV
jgi:protein gp37